MNRYLFDNRHPEAGGRFAALAELLDPWTFRHLDGVGLGEGVGKSVPDGRVLAPDIDVSWTEPAAGGVLEVRWHDVVHARLVLVHLEDRGRAAGHACPDERGPAEELANRLRTRIRTLMAERGADLAYGRTLWRGRLRRR